MGLACCMYREDERIAGLRRLHGACDFRGLQRLRHCPQLLKLGARGT